MKKINCFLFAALFTNMLLAQNQTEAPLQHSSTQKEQDENIRIQSAISEPFSISAGKITGQMYRIRIMILTDEDITIDSIWIGDLYLTSKLERYTMKDAQKKSDLKKNETVAMAGQIKDQSKMILEKCPYKYEGEALIAYTVGKKKIYFPIKHIKAQKGDKDNFKK